MLNDGDPSALMIRDRKGASALALAMQTRNHQIAQLIVTKAPHTALQARDREADAFDREIRVLADERECRGESPACGGACG